MIDTIYGIKNGCLHQMWEKPVKCTLQNLARCIFYKEILKFACQTFLISIELDLKW